MEIVIANSAVSLAPKSWLRFRDIRNYYVKRGYMPIIDGSKHQSYLQNIPKSERKDRPDILHFGLLTILGYRSFIDQLEVRFNLQNKWYSVNPITNLPRDQSRFYGILNQLLATGEQNPLIPECPSYSPFSGTYTIFSSEGRPLEQEDLETETFIFGGFAYGGFTSLPVNSTDHTVRLSGSHLELWTALSRFINLYLDVHNYKK